MNPIRSICFTGRSAKPRGQRCIGRQSLEGKSLVALNSARDQEVLHAPRRIALIACSTSTIPLCDLNRSLSLGTKLWITLKSEWSLHALQLTMTAIELHCTALKIDSRSLQRGSTINRPAGQSLIFPGIGSLPSCRFLRINSRLRATLDYIYHIPTSSKAIRSYLPGPYRS